MNHGTGRKTRTKVGKKASKTTTAKKVVGKTVTYKVVSKIPFTYPSRDVAMNVKAHVAKNSKGARCSGVSGKGSKWHFTCAVNHIVKYPEGVSREQILTAMKKAHPDVAFTVSRHR